MEYTVLNQLVGKTLKNIEVNRNNDEIFFETDKGEKFKMYHSQDCCESVTIEDIEGDLEDLIGSPLTMAEEAVSSDENPVGVNVPDYQESYTWTFYKFATIKGYVTIRWYGESNGYYSEGVDISKANDR